MRIVITSKGEDWNAGVDPRFGRADYLFMFDDETEKIEVTDNTDVRNAEHGAGPQTAKKLFELKPDVLITGNGPGGNAAAVLKKSGVKVFTGAENMNLKEAYNAWKHSKLNVYNL